MIDHCCTIAAVIARFAETSRHPTSGLARVSLGARGAPLGAPFDHRPMYVFPRAEVSAYPCGERSNAGAATPGADCSTSLPSQGGVHEHRHSRSHANLGRLPQGRAQRRVRRIAQGTSALRVPDDGGLLRLVNVALALGLLQFVSTFLIAWLYSRYARPPSRPPCPPRSRTAGRTDRIMTHILAAGTNTTARNHQERDRFLRRRPFILRLPKRYGDRRRLHVGRLVPRYCRPHRAVRLHGFLYSIGFLVARLVALQLVAELLRNSGKYTMADGLAFRMRQRPVRTAAAVSTITVAIFAPGLNVAFLVALAFAVAASGNLPALLYSLFWTRFTTAGAVAAIYGGLISAVLLVFSPVVSGSATAILPNHDWHWFPLSNPGPSRSRSGSWAGGWALCCRENLLTT
jgi:sodium:solute symporter family protein